MQAFVVSEDLGELKAGQVLHLDPEDPKTQALVEAGVIEEASEEDVNGGGDEEAADDQAEAAPMQEAAVTRALNQFAKNLEQNTAKAVELALAKTNKKTTPALTVPAQAVQPVFKGVGELVLHAWRANRGDYKSKSLLRAYQNEVRLKAPLGMNEGTNTQGGYDVKPEWFTTVWDKIRDYPKLVEKTTVIPAKSNTFNIPAINETSLADGSRHGGVLAYYVSEGSTATSSYPALTQVQSVLTTLVVLNYVTLQLLEDANIEGIEKLVNEKTALEILWQQNQAVINGSGSGQPTGILNQPSLITVTKSTHDSAAMFGFDDLANMNRALYPPSRNNAVWLMNPEAYSVLLQMTFPNAASTSTYPAWSLTYSGHDEFPLKLFGRPVIECLNCPQLGNAGDIILADLSQLFTYERPGIQFDISNEIQFPTLQVAYRTVYRYDIKSPWTAALSSVDGHYSYSPFVALQSRGT